MKGLQDIRLQNTPTRPDHTMKITQSQFNLLEAWIHAVADAKTTAAMTAPEEWEQREFADEVAALARIDAQGEFVSGYQ